MYFILLLVIAVVALGYSSNGSNYKKAAQFIGLGIGSVVWAFLPLLAVIAIVYFIFF